MLFVYGVRRKKSQCILGCLLSSVAQNQQQNIKVFDMGLDFCKKEVQKTEPEEDNIFFREVSLLCIAISGMEELREEKNQVLFLGLAFIFSQSRAA